VRRIGPEGQVSIFAGSIEQMGAIDGSSTAARLGLVNHLAIDGAGNLYASDPVFCTLRRISATGFVTTLAGKAGTCGDLAGAGAVARFGRPAGVAVGADGHIYMADANNRKVWRVTPTGVVSLLAGGSSGAVDGVGAAASFAGPGAMTLASDNTLLLIDRQQVRRITMQGEVTTVIGTVGAWKDGPAGTATLDTESLSIVAGPAGSAFVTQHGLGTVRRISADGSIDTVVGVAGERGIRTGLQPRLSRPRALAYDARTNRLIVLDQGGVLRLTLP
jgi:DNA-binding beta-propeller fold protein YncE